MEQFDVVVLGTGLKESILSGLMSSVCGKKVLHLDRNNYYGGEAASLNLETLYTKFKPGQEPKASLGKSRDYCVDLCPKFIMACGELVKILLLTKVTDYLEFKSVAGSYVYKGSKLYKVPCTATEAMSTSLVGMFEKKRLKNFLGYCSEYEESDPKTHKMDIANMTSQQLYNHFGVAGDTMSFCGHAVALYTDDSYLAGPAVDLVNRIKLYAYSVTKYGSSPYIYPKWGLGGLPEGFSRRCAVTGGTFMLNMDSHDPFLEEILYDGDGKVTGIKFGEKVSAEHSIPREIKCSQLIADPSYFIGTDKVKQMGKIIKKIAIFNEPIKNTTKSDSCQIIIPASNVKPPRKSDIYMCVASYLHNIAADGKYVAIMSTNAETDNPEKELDVAMKLLPTPEETFFWVSDSYQPTSDGKADNCFITSSYDATTHFQSCSSEVLSLYEAIAGEPLDLDVEEPEE